jgi:hypothetical protein
MEQTDPPAKVASNDQLGHDDVVRKLRYMGAQYAAGQASRGGGLRKHYLEEAAEEIEMLRARVIGVGAVAINSISRDMYRLPPVHGVCCCAENPNALVVVFKRRPKDDELRALHELARAFGA